ncbi:ribonuclease H-like domain-containing protein [Qiania dongpingensis]|uniref:Ribonuclease H-like domain-containing protein n=1 Tax=Qiania dongpingensis TaxID=2763669 RepID=A0A7G9G4G3_9FIRM|nr:ribonuclease H-like domain-containing protein [Qiania dongpingensis]QNM05695.1 ribonuclease H-like domain-containing protein [Qiania dongpingensis]
MIAITKEYSFKTAYDIKRLGNPEELLFFDIETTGLSSKRDMIYLIGCVYVKDGVWHLKQWFADSPEAERELLFHFLTFSSGFSTLVHFNGTTFDIPFLRERAAKFQTPSGRQAPASLDIYRKIRPLKKLLSLPDCKQKTLEAFLGVGREDPFNGGQLIEIYEEYLRSKDDRLFRVLLLHNEEDVKGLPAMLSLLSYQDFFGGTFRFEEERLHTYQTYEKETARELLVTCRNESEAVPVPCRFSADSYTFSCQEDRLVFRMPVLNGTLKYFFRNHSSYYYLPEEDKALHKSVAAYVDKNHRVKATARTCYQKRDGLFIPFPENAAGEHPLFYEEYKSRPSYVEYQENIWLEDGLLEQFLSSSLSFLK